MIDKWDKENQMTTEQKHEIEIPGLLEKGYRAVAYRVPEVGEYYIDSCGELIRFYGGHDFMKLIVEKIKPRRIVLEETEERANWGTEQLKFAKGTTVTVNSHKIWREVKEE